MTNDVRQLDFPRSLTEAKGRCKLFCRLDPLPDVAPALLNSGDIHDYARITGMIYPFEADNERLKEKLKPASYEINFLGTAYLVNDKGAKEVHRIRRDSPFTLPKNSIAFVSLATSFLLPPYIALRFNLKITHVHRGLLLGTGPLVDPGFAGHPLIPLHNLTSEDYILIGGEGLIWAEFTKLSPHRHWDPSAREAARYMPYPEDKKWLTPQEYFNKASHGKPARSSIPGEVTTAKETAEKAMEAVKRDRLIITISGIIIVILTVLGVLIPVWTLIAAADTNVSDASNTISDYRKAVDNLHRKVVALEDEVKLLREATKGLSARPPSSEKRSNSRIDGKSMLP